MTKKVIETVNGWYMENPKQKVELDDIVGLVKTDEPTDSVQLKKEAQLSICEKRIIELEKENEQLKKQSDNKQKHIVTLENKIVRMRKAIHKLEWLSTHRNADLQRENEQLKQEVTHWKKILDDYQQIVAKTLREQYHWLKNEDKISNHDKTVALLELEAIGARLGIDLI